MTMRMPTLLPFGEGCASGEVIDTRTRSIRRGSRHSMSEGWFVVIGGDLLRVSGLNVALGGGHGGSRTGSYERRGRVMPAEQRTLTSGALSKLVREW